MDSNQISDQIVEAINIIAKKKIEAISFDTTIEATIIDDSRASEGIYMVSNGSASFEAVSTETGYKKNDAVLVTIPQGDYSKQKIIAGKQVNKTDNSPIVYQSPFKTILNMTNNLIGDTSKIGEIGMIANHPNEYCWDVNTEKFTDSIAYTQAYEGEDKIVALIWDSEDILSEGEFNHTQIGIKAQFSTWLEEYGIVSGNYGLAAEIFFTHKDDIMSINAGDTNITQDIIDSHSFSKIIYLDSDSFFGNVYNFESYYTQEKTYDISEYTDFPITRIRLFAYQRNNFKDINNNKVEYEEDFNSTDSFSEIMPNIFIKDFYICLGASIEQFTADSAEIITRQGYNYMQYPPELKIVNENDIENLSEEEYIKDVLYNKNGDSILIQQVLKPFIRERHNLFYKYLKKVLLNKSYRRKEIKNIFNALIASKNNNFKKPIPADYDWTKNKIKINTEEKQPISDFLNNLLEEDNIVFSNEKTLELRWVHKDDFNEEVNVISSLPENYKIYWFKYKESVDDVENRHNLMDAHWDLLESKQEDDIFKITFNPNVKVGKERIQAIVVREDNGVEHLVVKSNVLELVNITETVSTATLTAVTRSLDDLAIRFDDGSGGNYFLYNRAKKLFSVEKNEVRTLTAVFDEDEDIIENKKDLEGPCSVKWIIPANNTMIIPWDKQNNCRLDNLTANENVYVIEEQLEENDKKSFFTYKINENLDYTKNNNTIILEVKRFDQTYFASATMRFGSAGTSGSDYTVVVNWNNDQAVFDISEANNDSYALSGEVSVLDQDGKNIINDNLNYEYSWYKVKSDDCNFDYAEETNEDLLYPINNNALGRFRIYDEELQKFRSYPNNEDENKIVTYCYANFLDKNYPSRSQDVSSNQFIDGSGDSFMINNGTSNNNEYVYYEYNLFLHDFKENTENIKINAPNEARPRILYAKSNFQERNEDESFYIFPNKRYKIQYKPFNNVYNKSFEKNNLKESGVIDIHTDGTIDYYYGSGSTKRKAFIKDKDRFIIDPYDRYYENLIYYYPTVVEDEKKYNETTLIIEEDKNKFYIKKDSEKELNIDDLYIFQITITSGLTEYPLIARFPIALKQNLYKDGSGKILTKNELKEEEGEHLFISTDGFKGATEIRYTTSGEVDFDKTQYSIHLSVWNEENKQIKSKWANQDLQVGKWKINSENEQFSQFDSLINNKIMKQTCIDYLLDKLGREESNGYLTSDKWKNIQRVFDIFLSPADEQNSNKNLIIKYFTDKIYEDYIIKNKPWPSRMAESGFLKSRLENSSDVFLINFIKILEKIKVIQNSNFEILLNETSILSPSSIYFKDAGLYGIQFVLISDPEDSSNSLTDDNQKVLWTQPIYIYQDNYPSTTLNEWGGKEILTDNEKGLIVANGFSAGKKEADNTFTGVVIGDWSKSDTDEAITKQTGIYGFNHGIMSYALKDDGTAFFGADGSGRIYLNGNNAKIYSANWIKASAFNNQSQIGNLYQQNQEGMMLDIDNGELLIQKKVGNISIVKDSDTETDYIYTSVQDNRKISLNENGLIISRRSFTLNGDGELEDLGSEKRLFELEMNSQESDDDVFYNFKYALRTPDYNYSNISSTYQTNGKIISGMEINFANQTITAFNSPKFDDQSSFKQKGFKLQAGGQWDATAQGTKGFKIIIDCQDKDDKVLKIGSSMPTSGANENFYVKTNGEIKGTLLQGNIIKITSGNFSVNTSGHLTCERIISKNKFLNFEGGLHIIGKDDQNDSLSCYKYYIDENRYDRGNIWCGEINCTSIKINGHVLTIGTPTENRAPQSNYPKLCLDGYGIDY